MTNTYLTYYSTVDGPNGRHFFYLKAVMLPTNFSGSLLLHFLKLLGEDLTDYFNIPTVAPKRIPAGTSVWGIDGTPWTAPSDLILAFLKDLPLINGSLGYPYQDLFCSNPYVVYTEDALGSMTPSDLPSEAISSCEDVSDSGFGFFVPEGYTSKTLVISSRHNNYPFWTNTFPGRWTAYDNCIYDADATPDYNLHVTLAMDAYEWLISQDVDSEGSHYLAHSNHRFRIDSCNEGNSGFLGNSLWYEGGTVSSLNATVHVLTNPAFFFYPPAFGVPVSINPINPLTYLLPFMILGMFSIPGIVLRTSVFQPFEVLGDGFYVNGNAFEVKL